MLLSHAAQPQGKSGGPMAKKRAASTARGTPPKCITAVGCCARRKLSTIAKTPLPPPENGTCSGSPSAVRRNTTSRCGLAGGFAPRWPSSSCRWSSCAVEHSLEASLIGHCLHCTPPPPPAPRLCGFFKFFVRAGELATLRRIRPSLRCFPYSFRHVLT